MGDSSAIEIEIQRAEKTDTISASEKIVAYLEEARKRFPPTLNITLQSLQGNYVEAAHRPSFHQCARGFDFGSHHAFPVSQYARRDLGGGGNSGSLHRILRVMYLMDLSVNMITMVRSLDDAGRRR